MTRAARQNLVMQAVRRSSRRTAAAGRLDPFRQGAEYARAARLGNEANALAARLTTRLFPRSLRGT
jgi:hypothetical protein